jgi:hypothetical protein
MDPLFWSKAVTVSPKDMARYLDLAFFWEFNHNSCTVDDPLHS